MRQTIVLTALFLCFCLSVGAAPKMRFAFMTDIHQDKYGTKDRYAGFMQALESVKKQKVDFIVIGGDVVEVTGMAGMDKISKTQADSMYSAYKTIFDKTGIPYYPTIGNHDRYFDKANGFTGGDEVFKSVFKDSYYTFALNGVRFFVLNSVQNDPAGGFYIDEQQMEWLRRELAATPETTPIVVSTHVPFYSMYYPVVEGKYEFRDVINNYRQLLDAFEGHNLKLVLQGHQHLHEEMLLQNVHYVTGGAVCADWWNGAFRGTQEGFIVVEVDKNDNFTWEYIDYGWTPRK